MFTLFVEETELKRRWCKNFDIILLNKTIYFMKQYCCFNCNVIIIGDFNLQDINWLSLVFFSKLVPMACIKSFIICSVIPLILASYLMSENYSALY